MQAFNLYTVQRYQIQNQHAAIEGICYIIKLATQWLLARHHVFEAKINGFYVRK